MEIEFLVNTLKLKTRVVIRTETLKVLHNNPFQNTQCCEGGGEREGLNDECMHKYTELGRPGAGKVSYLDALRLPLKRMYTCILRPIFHYLLLVLRHHIAQFIQIPVFVHMVHYFKVF